MWTLTHPTKKYKPLFESGHQFVRFTRAKVVSRSKAWAVLNEHPWSELASQHRKNRPLSMNCLLISWMSRFEPWGGQDQTAWFSYHGPVGYLSSRTSLMLTKLPIIETTGVYRKWHTFCSKASVHLYSEFVRPLVFLSS